MVDIAKSIQDLGLAGIIVFIVVMVVVGLHRKWWVPGWIYQQEREGRITTDIQAVRNGEALAQLARAVTGERIPPRERPEPTRSDHDPE